MNSWAPVFIGMRGSGKTTVGRAYAEACGLLFHDADAEVERRCGSSIAEIFATQGEAAFRALELPVLLELLELNDVVLATGGGAVLHAAVRERLQTQATTAPKRRPVVWLTAEPATLVQRLSNNSTRPSLLTGTPLVDEVAAILAQREPHYAACATHTLDTTAKSITEVVTELQWVVGGKRSC